MRAREEERYVRFVHERHAGLYRTAFLLTGNHHTAEDAVQSTREGVHVVVAGAAGEVPTERPQDLPGARRQAGPEERLVEAQTLWRALQNLSERQRAVVVLRYYADLSEAEIADTLGDRTGHGQSPRPRRAGRARRHLANDGSAREDRVEEAT